jgi:hypothetical protein
MQAVQYEVPLIQHSTAERHNSMQRALFTSALPASAAYGAAECAAAAAGAVHGPATHQRHELRAHHRPAHCIELGMQHQGQALQA